MIKAEYDQCLEKLCFCLRDGAPARQFNHLKKKILKEAVEGTIIVLRGVVATSRSYFGYDLDDIHFYDCRFSNVHVPACSRTLFYRCEFIDVTFAGLVTYLNHETADRRLIRSEQMRFQSCRLKGVVFQNLSFNSLSMISCSFSKSPIFYNCRCGGALELRNCVPLYRMHGFASLGMDMRDPNTFIIVVPQNGARYWPTWSTIVSLRRLPILQTSIAALLLLLALVAIVGWISHPLIAVGTWCVQDFALNNSGNSSLIVALTRDLHSQEISDTLQALSLTCEWLRDWNRTALVGISRRFAFLGSLFFAAALHASFCPPEINEYTLRRWSTDLGRPAEFYGFLARLNPPICLLCVVLYIFSIVLFFLGYSDWLASGLRTAANIHLPSF